MTSSGARPTGIAKWVAYLARYYLGSLVGQRRPLLGGIKLTHECNLSCAHCPFRKRKGSALSFPQAVSALQTLHDWGVRIAIFEGGEPSLWRDGSRDISHILSEARKRFYAVGVTTNGTFPIAFDADVVWVSIDGLESTHDRIRGRSFGRIMDNIAASPHKKILAHVTINTLNWQEIIPLVEFLSSRVKGITVQFHYPYTEAEEALFLPFDKRRRVLDDLIAAKRGGLPIANSFASLHALKENRWTCRPWMIASVDPDGTLARGCYVQNRGDISCARCGFSAHTEISLAYGGRIGSILAGKRIFVDPARAL